MADETSVQGGPDLSELMGTSISLDEMSAALAAPAKPDLAAIKFDGEAVPEHLRGKSASEVLALVQGLEKSLRISEDARTAQPRPQEVVISNLPQPPQQPPPPAVPTQEQLRTAWEQDAMGTATYLIGLGQQMSHAQFEQRIRPLLQGVSLSAESDARTRYPEEFQLFAKEIDAVKQQIPDASQLASPQAWDQLIGYVRGAPGNFDRLVEARTAKKLADVESERQRKAAAAAPLNFTGTQRSPGSQTEVTDPTELEIMRNLNFVDASGRPDHKEWLRWKNMRG